MFYTHESARSPRESALPDKAIGSWNYMELSLHTAWFYVVYSNLSDKGSSNIALLTNQDHLIYLDQDDEVSITQVYLVSPGQLNQTSGWKMEPLHKISVGAEKNDGMSSMIYSVGNNERYIDSFSGRHINTLSNIKQIFPSQLTC
jgi:hypothetical protein